MRLHKTTGAVLILAVLIVLIFFSRTLYTINQPEVSGVKPFRGTLHKLELSGGTTDWAERDTTYAARGGIVSAVLAKEGDSVKAGQSIVCMDFKRGETERRLAEMQNNRIKVQNEIQNTQRKLERLKAALGRAEEQTVFDTEQMTATDFDIIKAKAALAYAELAYTYGAISRRDLEYAQYTVQAVYLNAQRECETLYQEIEAKKLDLKTMQVQEEAYHELLRDYSAYAEIKAPCDGILSSLRVEKGQFIPENEPLFSLGIGNKFTVECTISLDNNFVVQGDRCELSNSSHVLEGLVTRVKPQERGKTVAVSVVSDEISEGETFDIRFEKESGLFYTLVPNAAVNQDNDGYFLNQLKRRKGILGEEYYLQRLNVYIGDGDSDNTAIIKGISFFEPVVLLSDKPVTEGDVVLLKNEDEFFEQ
ncbi:MAG: HlyD family secretion protein [Spirochaetaceae bacterium]|nr:HlyD family secretion protein [Spirochaetaceae bacterium]